MAKGISSKIILTEVKTKFKKNKVQKSDIKATKLKRIRKEPKIKGIHFRIPMKLHSKLLRLSRKRKVPMTQILCKLVSDYVTEVK